MDSEEIIWNTFYINCFWYLDFDIFWQRQGRASCLIVSSLLATHWVFWSVACKVSCHVFHHRLCGKQYLGQKSRLHQHHTQLQLLTLAQTSEHAAAALQLHWWWSRRWWCLVAAELEKLLTVLIQDLINFLVVEIIVMHSKNVLKILC